MSTVRLFFALWPDDAVRAALVEWSTALERVCRGRPTRPRNLHLTLAFLGDVAQARLEELKGVAAGVTARRFELVVDQPGYWKHNRIAWAGAGEVPAGLVEMVEELRAALRAAGFRFDEKPFVAHATLLRKASPAPLPALPPIVWRGNGFALVRSVPGPNGSDYAVAGEWRVVE